MLFSFIPDINNIKADRAINAIKHNLKSILKEVENILNQLQEEVDQFNRYGRNETISYAYGWAFSKDYTDCTLRVLFDKADHYMYENKRTKKEASKNE